MSEGVTFSQAHSLIQSCITSPHKLVQVVCLARCNGARIVAAHMADRSSEAEFRQHVVETSRTRGDYIIASYSRKGTCSHCNDITAHGTTAGLHQTGDGHFSPVRAMQIHAPMR